MADQQCYQLCRGDHGVLAGMEQVPDDALIQLNSRGINVALRTDGRIETYGP